MLYLNNTGDFNFHGRLQIIIFSENVKWLYIDLKKHSKLFKTRTNWVKFSQKTGVFYVKHNINHFYWNGPTFCLNSMESKFNISLSLSFEPLYFVTRWEENSRLCKTFFIFSEKNISNKKENKANQVRVSWICHVA